MAPRVKVTTEEFIFRSRAKHGDLYDYSSTIYVTSRAKLKIICKIHGPFMQRSDIHLAGHGCPGCYKERLMKRIAERWTNRVDTKVCISCWDEKPLEEFIGEGQRSRVVNPECNACATNMVTQDMNELAWLPVLNNHFFCGCCETCLSVEQRYDKETGHIGFCKKCSIVYRRERKKNKEEYEGKEAKYNTIGAYRIKLDKTRYLRVYTKEYQNNEYKYKHRMMNKLLKDYPAESKLFLRKMVDSDFPEDRDGWLFIKCKRCETMFNPTSMEAQSRIVGINSVNKGDNNFYCSDICKDTCDVFAVRDRRKSERRNNSARRCQTPIKKALIEIQCGDTGNRYCERCGDILDVDLHHTMEVANNVDVNNASGMMLLCFSCHTEIHRSCK